MCIYATWIPIEWNFFLHTHYNNYWIQLIRQYDQQKFQFWIFTCKKNKLGKKPAGNPSTKKSIWGGLMPVYCKALIIMYKIFIPLQSTGGEENRLYQGKEEICSECVAHTYWVLPKLDLGKLTPVFVKLNDNVPDIIQPHSGWRSDWNRPQVLTIR